MEKNKKPESLKAFPDMTLRDYFAAKAMQGIITNKNMQISNNSIAEKSYEMANAMLKQRKK